uniref:Uncharacterized protein n=1 Tax=Physcomitrium patens TaxID=3218 RepID=A0A2K1IBI8_PHYPA|nr:hypothetical protein PHYPA_030108 [Physcomitrium patens]
MESTSIAWIVLQAIRSWEDEEDNVSGVIYLQGNILEKEKAFLHFLAGRYLAPISTSGAFEGIPKENGFDC